MPAIDPYSFGCGVLFALILPIIDIISVWIIFKRK